MEQLCAEGRQLSKYWVVGRWDVGVEDRHANGGKKALDPNLHSLFLIPKQIGGTNGPPPHLPPRWVRVKERHKDKEKDNTKSTTVTPPLSPHVNPQATWQGVSVVQAACSLLLVRSCLV